MKPDFVISFRWDATETDPLGRWGEQFWKVLIAKLRERGVPSGVAVHLTVQPDTEQMQPE
jgi:hypothetical protein